MLRGLLVLLGALALGAPVAAAQGDQIFVDPGSPSGKEYALPVESARKQAAQDAGKGSSDPQPAPLFGEGVDAPGKAAAGSDGARAGAGSGSGSGAANGGAGAAATGGDTARPATLKAEAAAPGGGVGLAAIIGVGAGVLALGGAIGVLLRRRAARDA